MSYEQAMDDVLSMAFYYVSNKERKDEVSNMTSKNKQVLRFLCAQTISLFGSSIVQYAIIWYITLTTGSGKMLTISTLCAFLPQIAISLFAGVWIDRYSRKYMIILPDCIIAFSTLLLAIAFYQGFQSLPLLYLVLILRSAGTGIQTPAVNAFLPELVEKEDLMKINGFHSTLSSFMMFLSPGISGLMLSNVSFEATLLLDVVTAIVGVGLTLGIHTKTQPTKTASSSIVEIKEGFSYLKQHHFLRQILVYQLLVLFLISPSAFLTPLMVARNFGPEVWRLTASEMTYSLGMVAGGLLISVWQGFSQRLLTTLAAGACYGIMMIGLGSSPWFFLYLCCNTMIGITSPCYNTPLTVTIQEVVPTQYHGRVFSLLQITTSCALPMGMLLFGPLSDFISINFLFIFSGTLVILLSAYMYVRKRFVSKESN